MGFYENLILFGSVAVIAWCAGIYMGSKMADKEWLDIIDFIRHNPNATRADLDLVFKLDRRTRNDR